MFYFFKLLVLPVVVSALVSEQVPHVEYRRSGHAGPMKRAVNDAEHAELRPIVHPEVDQYLFEHLHPGKAAPLIWSHGGQHLGQGTLVASLDAKFNALEVVLDNSKYISKVKCAPTSMSIQFHNATAFAYAKEQWSNATELVFVSSAEGCHLKYPGHYGFFNTTGSSIIYDQKHLTASPHGQQISIKEAVAEFNIAWDHYEASTAAPPVAVTQAPKADLKARALKCNADNCLRNLQHLSGVASDFCATYTTAIVAATSAIPAKISMCTQNPTSVSSACSCLITSTVTAGTSPTTSPAKTTSLSSKSTLITPAPVISTCKADNCLRGFQHSLALATPFCATYTKGGSQSIASFASVCSLSPSRISSACSCVAPPTSCGTKPTAVPDSVSSVDISIACGSSFDEKLDSALGALEDANDLTVALESYMPGVSGLSLADYTNATGNTASRVRRHSKLAMRGLLDGFCSWVDDNIIQPVVYVVEVVVEVYVEIIKLVVKTAEEIADEAVELVKEAAQALLPTFNPSISFTMPVDIEAPSWMLEDSPWGQAYKIYEYTADGGDFNYGINADSLSNLLDLDELVPTISIDGVEEIPEPGVQLYCVDCSITGSLLTKGSATYTLLVGFTDLQLSFNGDIHAQYQLGVNAYYSYEWTLAEIRILEVGIPGFFIPDVIVVGPMLTLGVDATIKIEALGQLLAGARYDFDHIGATIDFFDHSKSSSHGTTPAVSTLFQAHGEVNVTASVGVPLGIGVGIDILDGAWSEEVAVVDRPALEAVTTFSFNDESQTNCTSGLTNCTTAISQDTNNGTCNGVAWYVDFVNEVTFDLFGSKYDIGTWHGPKLAEGCIGKVPSQASSSSTATTTATGFSSVSTGGASGGDKTLLGCSLVENVVQNNGFEQGTAGWTLLDDDNVITGWGAGADGQTTSQPNSGYLIRANGKDGIYGFSTTITLCTDTSYDIVYQARYKSGDGVGYVRAADFGQEYGFQESNPLYVVTRGKDFMSQEGPFSFTVPSSATYQVCSSCPAYVPWYVCAVETNLYEKNCKEGDSGCTCVTRQHGTSLTWSADGSSVTGTLRILFETLYGTYTEIRVDDITVVPSAWNAKKKRDSLEGPVTHAPAPTAAPALQRRSTAVFSAVSTTDDAAAADITIAASSVGAADYKFPSLSAMLANATVVSSSAATSATASPNNKYINLRDTTSSVQLAANTDGNIYLAPFPGNSPGTSFISTSSIITNDDSGRSFHYYPDTMAAYGVSRIRLSTTGLAPIGSQLLTLVPVTSGVGTIYMAVDTQGAVFLLAWCNSVDWLGAKVFIIKDATGVQTLETDGVQWIVTGDEVTKCAPLLITSRESPLI